MTTRWLVAALLVVLPCGAARADVAPWHAATGATAVVQDCADCPRLVVLPAGRFMMGSDIEEPRRLGLPDYWGTREQPRHPVTIRHPFALGQYEVTRAQFRAFVRAAGYLPAKGCFHFVGDEWQFGEQRSWEDPGYAQGDEESVTCVNWHDASAYVAWLGERTGRRYRLPSESEWEYGARAGTATAYWFGDDAKDICRYVNLADQDARERFHWDEKRWEHGGLAGWRPVPCHDGHATMAPVAAFPPNPFGLYGMLGNANEWVADCWVENYASGPVDERPRLATGDCGVRVLRGESWVAIAASVRSAFRIRVNATDRRFAFGIRVARDLDAAEVAAAQVR